MRELAGLVLVVTLVGLPRGTNAAAGADCTAGDDATKDQPEAAKEGFLRRQVRAILEDTEASERSVHLGPFHPKIAVVSAGASLAPQLHFWAPDLGTSALDLHASAAYSLLRYQYYDLQLGRLPHRGRRLPRFVTGSDNLFPLTDLYAPLECSRFSLFGSLRYRRYPREDFYGVGSTAGSTGRSDFLLRDSLVELVASRPLQRRVTVTARAGLLQTSIGPGSDSGFPNSELLYDEAAAPGLVREPDFFHLSAGVFADFRDEPDNPHRGGALALAIARFDERGDDAYEWTRLALDARAFRSLFSSRHVLALRLVAAADFPDAHSRVPFYLQSTLGGGHLLRGFHSFRFRDHKLLASSLEYRWEAARALELALFYDAGKVFTAFDDVGLRDLESTWGAGIRFKSPKRVRLRIDVARSRESTRLHVKLAPSF